MPRSADPFGMGDDADDGPDDPTEDEFAPPLPPEDRLWRHPSEVALAAAQAAVAPARRVRSDRAAIALVAGLIAITLSTAAVVLAGGLIGNGGTASALSDDQLGDATPAPGVQTVTSRMVAHAQGQQAWLGITGIDLGREASEALGLDGGVEIVAVTDDGPAAAAGVRAGDVVVTVHDAPVPSMDDLVRVLRTHLPGDRVTLGVRRAGDWMEFEVVLDSRR